MNNLLAQVFVVGIYHEICINFLNLKKTFKFCQRDEEKKRLSHKKKNLEVYILKRKGSLTVGTNSVLFGMEYVT